jgi:hypothetical protein
MRAKRVDDNQKLIVEQLRKLNISVQHLHTVGQGCPDLLLGFRNRNFLIELKDESKPASAKKLTNDEQEFFNEWNGQVSKCETLEEIMQVVGL